MSAPQWAGLALSLCSWSVPWRGLTSRDVQMVRAAYLATGLTTWFVIVPLAFASLQLASSFHWARSGAYRVELLRQE